MGGQPARRAITVNRDNPVNALGRHRLFVAMQIAKIANRPSGIGQTPTQFHKRNKKGQDGIRSGGYEWRNGSGFSARTNRSNENRA
jgi:hypothetical protein